MSDEKQQQFVPTFAILKKEIVASQLKKAEWQQNVFTFVFLFSALFVCHLIRAVDSDCAFNNSSTTCQVTLLKWTVHC